MISSFFTNLSLISNTYHYKWPRWQSHRKSVWIRTFPFISCTLLTLLSRLLCLWQEATFNNFEQLIRSFYRCLVIYKECLSFVETRLFWASMVRFLSEALSFHRIRFVWTAKNRNKCSDEWGWGKICCLWAQLNRERWIKSKRKRRTSKKASLSSSNTWKCCI